MVPRKPRTHRRVFWQILVLMSIAANTPYDVGGAEAFRFHSFISMSTGILIAWLVGRVAALMVEHGGTIGLLMLLPVIAFTVSFVMLFGLTALYGTSAGALHGRPVILLFCVAQLTAGIIAFSFGHERSRRR